LTGLLDNLNRPQVWLEVAPPRGLQTESLLNRLGALRGQVDAINLVDNALGKVKMSPLVFGAMIKQRLQIPVAINVSCRDRNRFALLSDLIGAAALGIDAVVALQGDRLPAGGSAGAHAVHDLDTFGLLRMMADLSRGDTGEGKRLLKTLPTWTVGAVANPNRPNLERESDLMRRKAETGARFVVTQPVFEENAARRFAAEARRHALHAIIGILPVKREAMAVYMKEKIKDLSGAAGFLDRYAGMEESDARQASISHSLHLMEALAGDVSGFNIMSGGGPSLAIELALAWRRSHPRVT
jgi:5,10-methylenetetrahydrofolate reductase